MNPETQKCAREAFEVLKIHMSIQDELFRPTLRKIIRIPGFYRPVPYEEKRDVLRNLSEKLLEIRAQIKDMRPEGDTEDGRFLISLRAYCTSLSEAILALSGICDRLADRSRGGDYQRTSYDKEVDAFRALESKSMEIGKTLNRLNRKDISR